MFESFLWINVKILAVLMIYGFAMGKIRQIAYANLHKKTGNYLIIDFFNLIGTPVHEIGHLIFGLLFGYRITKVCLYRTMKTAKSHGGTLGYVKMNHKENTLFQKIQGDLGQFFVGIGPLLFGPAFLFLCTRFLPPTLTSLPSILRNHPGDLLHHLTSFHFGDILISIVFLYAIIGISINMELSKTDLRMAIKGLVFLEIILLLFSVICSFFSFHPAPYIDMIYHYNLLISCIGIFCGLFANLIALI